MTPAQLLCYLYIVSHIRIVATASLSANSS